MVLVAVPSKEGGRQFVVLRKLQGTEARAAIARTVLWIRWDQDARHPYDGLSNRRAFVLS